MILKIDSILVARIKEVLSNDNNISATIITDELKILTREFRNWPYVNVRYPCDCGNRLSKERACVCSITNIEGHGRLIFEQSPDIVVTIFDVPEDEIIYRYNGDWSGIAKNLLRIIKSEYHVTVGRLESIGTVAEALGGGGLVTTVNLWEAFELCINKLTFNHVIQTPLTKGANEKSRSNQGD